MLRPVSARDRLRAMLLGAFVALACPSCHRAVAPGPGLAGAEAALLAWPPLTSSTRPWAIWWWPGSAVDDGQLAAHLDRYAAAGLGGVHVVPIYGVVGAEDRTVPFLSPPWLDRVRFTVTAARARGLGVDLATGTGWPFGGPTVAAADGSRRAIVQRFTLDAGGRLDGPVRAGGTPGAALRTLMAYPPAGAPQDVTARVHPASGQLDWAAPAGGWRLYALFEAPTGMKVKRAAPGGEGLVVDQLAAGALPRYLGWFDQAFRAGRPPGVRAFTSDSFEDMASDFTPDFLAAFAARRGHDLRLQLPALAGEGDAETIARVLADYRETVSDLLLERMARPWTAWAQAQGAQARNQAHGAPGNLLDLYAAADIPETESFGPSHLPIPGLRTEANLPEHFGKPDTLFSKLASSAAHLAGRALVSSESATWLGEHFQVAPSQVKPELDRLFLAGINHLFLHGVTYSPADAPWPGWLFYASTDFGPESGFWPAMPGLSAYVGRTQAMLQASQPDRDLLLYFPMHDLWQQAPAKADGRGGRLVHLTAHAAGDWLHQHPTGLGQVAADLLARGHMFDFVSDRLLDKLPAEAGTTILVPGARLMPLATFRRLRQLAEGGAVVLFAGDLPADVPGLGTLAQRRAALRAAVAALGPGARQGEDVRVMTVGQGRFVVVGGPVQAAARTAVSVAGVRRERMADMGLSLLRQRIPDAAGGGHLYFLANLGATPVRGPVPLATPAAVALVMDPLSGRIGTTSLRSSGTGAEIQLELLPGESLLLRTLPRRPPGMLPAWRWPVPAGEALPLAGPWEIQFRAGGPVVPTPVRMDHIAPWTERADPAVRDFSGSAVYRTSFTLDRLPGPEEGRVLELGGVHAVAAVRLNGQDTGLLWALPFRLDVTRHLRPGGNLLELEVSSLPANRVAAQARSGQPRVRYHDIDFVDIRYRPFDPRGWAAVPSGLSGPALLRPIRYR